MNRNVTEKKETLATLKRMGFTYPAQVAASIRAWHHGRISATRSERGRELFTKLAPRLLEAAGLEVNRAEIECNLGFLELFRGRYDRALAYLEQSRRRYAELDMPHDVLSHNDSIIDQNTDRE